MRQFSGNIGSILVLAVFFRNSSQMSAGRCGGCANFRAGQCFRQSPRQPRLEHAIGTPDVSDYRRDGRVREGTYPGTSARGIAECTGKGQATGQATSCCGRSQNCLSPRSGTFVESGQCRARDRQRYGTAGGCGLAQNCLAAISFFFDPATTITGRMAQSPRLGRCAPRECCQGGLSAEDCLACRMNGRQTLPKSDKVRFARDPPETGAGSTITS